MQIEGTETLADAQLVALAKCGERSAFGELARRHYRRFVAVALSLLRNREDAEDEVQTALRKGLEHIGDLQTNEHFGTWQARIVINECYMRMRDRKHYQIVDRAEALPEDHLLLFKTAGPTAEATLLYDEALEIVRLRSSTSTAIFKNRIDPLRHRSQAHVGNCCSTRHFCRRGKVSTASGATRVARSAQASRN